MDKLKKVFSPGSSKDDEVLYGDAQTSQRENASRTHDSQPPQLHPSEGAENNEGSGVLRQVINPGGEKYDEYHGTTATTAAPSQDPGKLSTTAEGQKDSTVTQQILRPSREKYDEQRYDTTVTSTDAPARHAAPQMVSPDAQLQTDEGQKDHSILRQIVNPRGDKYDAEGYGSTAHVVGQGDTTGVSSGMGSGSSTTQGIPDRTAQTNTGTGSHLGRDAAVAGGLGAAGGAAAYAGTHDRDTKPATDDFGASKNTREHVGPTTTTTTTTTTSSQPITERSHPLGGQTAGGDHINPVSAPAGTESHLGRDAGIASGLGAAGVAAGAYSASQHDRAGDYVTPTTGQANTAVLDRPHPLGGHDASGDHIDPVSAPEDPIAASSTAGTHSHLGRDTGVAGVGAAAVGTTGIGGNNASTQLNSAPRDVQEATFTARQYQIPGDNCDGRPAEGYVHHTHGPHSTDTANRLDPHVPGEFPTEASLAGGLVGAGGAYTDNSSIAGRPTEGGNTASLVGAGAGSSSLTDRGTSDLPGTTSSTVTTQTQPGQGQHYGRDAALGAGAGAAGYAAYEATEGRGDTGPASKTIGPHDSNIANIFDPRVQPQPEKMKGSTTAGLHPSETEDHHRGRDAALVGGAGALGGAGVYESTRDHDKLVTEQLASTQGTQTQPVYHASTDTSATTQPGTNFPDSRHRIKESAHAGEVSHRDEKDHSSSHTKEEEKEKKPSLIHRILHPGEGKEKDLHHDDKKHDHGSSSSQSHEEHNKLHKKALGEGKTTEEAAQHSGNNDGRVIEPHTGLPMNVEKYGTTGQGGTDGAQNITGYHETDPAIRDASTGTGVGAGTRAGHAQPGQEGVAGPDWDAIEKANTPY